MVHKLRHADLDRRGADVSLDLERVEDMAVIAAVREVYPEAVPSNAAPSFFDMG